jgi:hypothetical protein
VPTYLIYTHRDRQKEGIIKYITYHLVIVTFIAHSLSNFYVRAYDLSFIPPSLPPIQPTPQSRPGPRVIPSHP